MNRSENNKIKKCEGKQKHADGKWMNSHMCRYNFYFFQENNFRDKD